MRGNTVFNSRANVATTPRSTAARRPICSEPHIHLCDVYSCTARIELAIREVGAEHQQNIAIEHGVVARGEADQPGHSRRQTGCPTRHAPCRGTHARWELSGGPPARGLHHVHPDIPSRITMVTTAIAIEERREPIDIGACGHRDGLAGGAGRLLSMAARPRRAEGRCRPEVPLRRRRDCPPLAGSRSPERGASGSPPEISSQ